MKAHGIPTLRRELIFLTRHRESYRQVEQFKMTMNGPVGCLFGWVVAHTFGPRAIEGDDGRYVRIAGDVTDTWCVAKEILGLSQHEAITLSSVGNTLADLWHHAEDFSDGEIAVPEDLPAWAHVHGDPNWSWNEFVGDVEDDDH